MLIIDKIENCLREKFSPSHLIISDDSHKHVGHAGSLSGGGHFTLEIQASIFHGKNRVESHRLIYKALEEFMVKEIHALSIKIL